MSQAHVTDFFSARKKTNGGNPSKRRKLQEPGTSAIAFSQQETNIKVQPTPQAPVTDARPENAFSILPRANSSTRSNSKQSSSRKGTVGKASNQKSLKALFATESLKDGKDEYREALRAESEEVTSAWDEHDGHLLTPSKRGKSPIADTETYCGSRKRTRCGTQKSDVEFTPAKEQNHVEIANPKAKKHLDLMKDESKQEVPKSLDVPMSPRLKKTIEKVRQLGNSEKKHSAENIKEKLKKCGRLEEIKAQLTQMNKNLKELKTVQPGESPKLQKFDSVTIEKTDVKVQEPKVASPVKPKAPAYERFHSLAIPAPPTLSLPYRYKLLAEMFRNCDTVVSMLNNRGEVCTFSKLKAAVQDMGKRNFEEKNLGQIKTVDPDAYTYRQEKGFPAFGQKVKGYQLTVEARLPDDDTKATSYKTKQTFTAKHLLERRTVFSNKLLNIVKRYHKEFLANLDKPLNVPDDKITRWHPKFRLDEVPDIESSDLPQPPNVQVYQTAKDVLENARGKVLPNVEKALQDVSSKQEVPTPTEQPSEKKPSEVKGIPQSLLEKIRAKEAAKMEAAMMRDPAEDKCQKMLQKLPEMMRILRAVFVQEKKPALQKSDIINKLGDSCKSAIAMGDVETHLNLMLEVLPKWLTQVEIKKGKYIKMDRNQDLQTLINHVNGLVKK